MAGKYIILIGDGMADWPIPAIANRTPLEAAEAPNMDFMAANGAVGRPDSGSLFPRPPPGRERGD